MTAQPLLNQRKFKKSLIVLLHPSEYPPEPTHSYDVDQQPEVEDYDPYGAAPTQVTMITEEAFPYATTTESHYAKEDTETMEVPYEYPPAGPDTGSSEESGGDSALGEVGPTECDCEPGEPGFAGFAGPKGSRGPQGKTGEPGAQGREGYKGTKGVQGRGGDAGPVHSFISGYPELTPNMLTSSCLIRFHQSR
eukprot:superscaffoldBa00009269_g23978